MSTSEKEYDTLRKVVKSGSKTSPRAAYLYGKLFLDLDPGKAVKYFKISAQGGYPDGVFMLAYCMENGLGTIKNVENALKLYCSLQTTHEEARKRACFLLAQRESKQ